MKALFKLMVITTWATLISPAALLAADSTKDGSSGLVLLFGFYAAAIVLALVEICLIPGFGLAGVGSIAALAFCGYQAFALYGFETGSIVTLVLLVLAIVVVVVAIKAVARTEAGRAFVLDKSLDATANDNKEKFDADIWVGRTLTAMSDLRPGGQASYEDDTVDVYSEGSFLHSGDKLKVFKVRDDKLYVKKLEDNQEDSNE